MLRYLRFIFLFAILFSCKISFAQRITTTAGNGIAWYAGDGGKATAASLFNPEAVAVDDKGRIFISDRDSGPSSVVRFIDTNGIIHTFAGTGVAGFGGDGGPATAAQVNFPHGASFDKKGNVYIMDAVNKRVRKVDSNGIITTYAGNGSSTVSGDGGAASAAGLGACGGICADSLGNIYIGAGLYIRKIDTQGIITKIAGTGISGFSGDGGKADTAQIGNLSQIAFDRFGNLYFTDVQRIRKINSNGFISTVAGTGVSGYSGDGGPATACKLYGTQGVIPDDYGNIFIGEAGNHRIRKVNAAGIITTIAGSGTTGAGFGGYSGDGGSGTAARLNAPSRIWIDKNRYLYIADHLNSRIRRIDLKDTVFVNGINELTALAEDLQVYPNPSNTGNLFVNMQTNTGSEPAQLVITDIAGAVVKECTIKTNTEAELQLQLPAGMYFINASAANKRWVKKIVVE
jgi:trimeric autotransporter adhesin